MFLILKSNSEFVSVSIRALMQTRIVWLYMSLAWGRWPEYMHWENIVLRLLDPGSHLRLYRCQVVFQPHCCLACCPGCTEAQEVQSYSFICEACCSCQAYAGRWRGMPPQTSLSVARPQGCLHEGSQDWAAAGRPRWCSWQGPSCVQPKLDRGMK